MPNVFCECPSRRSSVSRGTHFFGLALLLLLLANIAHAQDRDLRILFRKGVVDPAVRDAPGLERPQASDDLDVGHRILQFDRIPDHALRQQLKARGITLLTYIPNNAYWVSIDQPRMLDDAEQIAGDVLLSWRPDAFFRVSEEISNGDIPPHAFNPDGSVGILVLVFQDVRQSDAESAFLAVPGVDIVEWQSPEIVLLQLPEDRIAEVAELDIVHWLEPRPAPYVSYNATSAARIGVNVLQNPPYSLDGSGVGVGVWDKGRVDAHGDFGSRLTVVDAVALNDHATHVAGTIGGSGAGNSSARGMAPSVNLYSYDFNADLAEIRVANQVRLSNHSYGVSTGWSYTEAGWVNFGTAGFGQYSATTAARDDVAFDTGLISFYAAGNDRVDCPPAAACDGPYDTINTFATAKNIITVCATSDSDGMSSFSSWGPVDDGRVKPDLCANGTSLNSTDLSQGYRNQSGTSMASPSAAGAGALLYQRLTKETGFPPSPHTLKALLIHGAKDLGRPGPDYEYGWGLIDADRSADLIASNSFVTGVLGVPAKETINLPFDVANATNGVKATLVWTDPQGSPGAAKALVNDLNMVLIAPDGTTHLPWLLNPAAPTANATRAANAIDNVEQVFVPGPAPAGQWIARITGVGTIPQGPQTFAVVIDGVSRGRLDNGQLASGSLPMASLGTLWHYYYFDLPAGATKAFVELHGLTRGADLYVSYGAPPTVTSYDCKSTHGGTLEETCWFLQGLPPNGGRWYVGVLNDDFNTANLPAQYSVRATWLTAANPIVLTRPATSISHTSAVLNAAFDFITPGTTVRFDWGETTAFGNSTSSSTNNRRAISGLQCGKTYYFWAIATTVQGTTGGGILSFETSPCPVPVTQLHHGMAVPGTLPAGEPEAQWRYYYFDVPEAWTDATMELFNLSGMGGNVSGDGNLYVRKGQLPTLTDFDCRPYISSNSPESCDFITVPLPPASAGRWYIGVNNNFTMENVPISFSVRATWSPATFPPIVVTGSAASISRTSATLSAMVNPRGLATTAEIAYGPTAAYGNVTPAADVGSDSSDVLINTPITGLECGKIYHFRALASNADGAGQGENQTFRTSDCPFEAPPLGNGETGSYTLPPGAQNTSWHHYSVELPEGVTSVRAELFDLSADADLYLRKDQPSTVNDNDCRSFSGSTTPEICEQNLATNPPVSPGLWYVSVANFTANVSLSYTIHVTWTTEQAQSPPVVTTDPAIEITQTSATLNATVNPQQLSTSAHFEYGPTSEYGNTTPPADTGSGDMEVPVSKAITDLVCGETYHFRIVATNSDGTSEGDDQSFETGDCGVEPPLLANGAKVSFMLPPDARNSSWHHFRVQLPIGVTSVTAELFDLTADADLYLRKDVPATLISYDCRPFIGGTNPETCIHDGNTTPPVSPGLWYLSVTNWAENVSIGYSVRVTWTTLAPENVFTDGFEPVDEGK